MTLALLASYAYTQRKHLANRFRAGEGLVGQCALEKQSIVLSQVPDDYERVARTWWHAPLRVRR